MYTYIYIYCSRIPVAQPQKYTVTIPCFCRAVKPDSLIAVLRYFLAYVPETRDQGIGPNGTVKNGIVAVFLKRAFPTLGVG